MVHTRLRSGDVLNLDTKVRAFIDNHTTLARLWDIESLNLAFCHDGVCLPIEKCEKIAEMNCTELKETETCGVEIAVMKWQQASGLPLPLIVVEGLLLRRVAQATQ
jgi:hypothetical protein